MLYPEWGRNRHNVSKFVFLCVNLFLSFFFFSTNYYSLVFCGKEKTTVVLFLRVHIPSDLNVLWSNEKESPFTQFVLSSFAFVMLSL